MGRIVAIDFGLKRIGIALSDPEQKLGLPLGVVEGGKKSVANTQNKLAPYLLEIEKILVGFPLLLNGKKSDMCELVELFAQELQKTMNCPIELVDERLSSEEARRSLQQRAKTRKQRTQMLDATAALLLLQTYLEKRS